MASARIHRCKFLILLVIIGSLITIEGKSVKLRNKNGRKPAPQHVLPGSIIYPQVKASSQTNPISLKPLRSPVFANKKKDISQEINIQEKHTAPQYTSFIVPEIQSIFDNGLRDAFHTVQKYFNRFHTKAADKNNNDRQEINTRIPGFPTTPFFQSINLTSVLKLLEATDGPEAQQLAETAVIDVVSQLGHLIGFEDLRDWLGIVLMYFLLGPILIPLFWLPISLFGMAGLLVPLFLFNPPSKLNTGVIGHDPIVIEHATEKRSFEKFLSTFSIPKQFRSESNENIESCLERVSCHMTRLYRDNPISKWLTSHFNTTKIEYARLHPSNDINGDSSRAEFDCSKYPCLMFPAA